MEGLPKPGQPSKELGTGQKVSLCSSAGLKDQPKQCLSFFSFLVFPVKKENKRKKQLGLRMIWPVPEGRSPHPKARAEAGHALIMVAPMPVLSA